MSSQHVPSHGPNAMGAGPGLWTRAQAEVLLSGPARGERLKRARLLLAVSRGESVSQAEMAEWLTEWLGVTLHQSQVSRHELGERVPSPLEYAAYAAVTGQPIEWLAFGIHYAPEPPQPRAATPYAPAPVLMHPAAVPTPRARRAPPARSRRRSGEDHVAE